MQPIGPGRELAARALGDHRLMYLEYEGDISGQRGRVRRVDSGTYRAIVWSAGPCCRRAGGISTGRRGRATELRTRVSGYHLVALSHGKLRLKNLPRWQAGPVKSPFCPIRVTGEPDLAGADLKFFELDVLSFDIRRITHEDDRIPVFSRPFGINTMVACILDNAVQNVICRDGQDAGADLFESQLDGITTRYAGSGDHGDHRLDRPLLQQESEGDPVELEKDPRFVDFRRKLVGEMGDEVFGQPRVDFLVGEDGLPARLIADIVAKLKALCHELLGLARALFPRQENHVTVIGGLVGQAKTTCPPPESTASTPRPRPIQSSRLLVLCIGHPDLVVKGTQ